ncbi:MAG: hypothetical protein D6730_01530 [Bacteroidetes bacterium]|nr:MAG: hypothetical protein D6730_01530 [Bacteroidota bacterium]
MWRCPKKTVFGTHIHLICREKNHNYKAEKGKSRKFSMAKFNFLTQIKLYSYIPTVLIYQNAQGIPIPENGEKHFFVALFC